MIEAQDEGHRGRSQISKGEIDRTRRRHRAWGAVRQSRFYSRMGTTREQSDLISSACSKENGPGGSRARRRKSSEEAEVKGK